MLHLGSGTWKWQMQINCFSNILVIYLRFGFDVLLVTCQFNFVVVFISLFAENGCQ